VTKFVREFVEVPDHASLDEMIAMLTRLRDSLPADAEAELRLRGDDVFGRHMAISYLRPQTAEEAACDARYENAYRHSRQRQLTDLEAELAGLSEGSATVSLAA